jgi:TolB-like protein
MIKLEKIMVNKKQSLVILVMVLVFGLKEVHAQQVSFSNAIQTASEEISINIERGSRIAVLSMQADSVMMSNHLIDEMIVTFVKMNRFTVVNRAQMELITAELHFNMSGYVSDETAQSIGKMLGVQFIITGVFGPIGDLYRFSIQVIEVETAAIRGVYTVNVQNDYVILSLLGDAGMPVPLKLRKNWISGEATFFGIGARYERMLNNKFSIGGNFIWDYANDFIWDTNVMLILANFRFYPGGNSLFYLELGAGFGSGAYYWDNPEDDWYRVLSAAGFAMVPAIGMKFGGKRTGFYVNPFINAPVIIGVGRDYSSDEGDYDPSNTQFGFFISLRFGVGLGYAW